MNEASDQDLLTAIVKKDMASMEVFYRRYESIVYRFAIKKMGNEANAAEIVNTVMLEVWKTAERFEARSKVSTWLLGIAHHRIIDLLRKVKHDHDDINDVALESEAKPLDIDIENSQLRRFILGCMKTLSGDHRQVMDLLFFNDASYHEIADILSVATGTVKSRVHHAKTALKSCLTKHIDYDSGTLGANS